MPSRPFPERRILACLEKARPEVAKLAGKEITQASLSILGSIAARVCVSKNDREAWEHNGQMKKDALHDSLVHLLGKRVGLPVLVANMHRIIANWHLIDNGVAVPLWQGEQITSDVLFMDLARETKGEKFIYHVRTKVRTGLAAGLILNINLYEGQICRFLDKEAGVGKWNCAAEELSGMRARITHSRLGTADKIDQWNATEAQKTHNKKLTEARADMSKCSKLIPCNTCRCTVSQCPLAVWTDKEIRKV